jgi:steroid 5-alpha reductase family enzyme
MPMVELLISGLIAILLYMTVIWLASLALKNSSIVDIFWGPGFALAAWVYYFFAPVNSSPRALLVVALVTIWGLRLGIHIGRRNIGKEEDYRYQKWREDAGAKWWWYSFFKVFLLQGIMMWLISSPLAVAQLPGAQPWLSIFDLIGIALWVIGFVFEAVGDWQLTRFKADPSNKGKVMRTGLWRYTRHPNYFGDATLWWGYFAFALNLLPLGLITVYSPILMTVLLMRVSGVALLEHNLKKTKPEYAEYIESTNAFFPGLPHPKAD